MAKPKLLVGLGSCGVAAGGMAVYNHLKEVVPQDLADIEITSCIGMCWAEPLVEVVSGENRTLFGYVNEEFSDKIFEGVKSGKLPEENRVRESEEGKDYLGKQVKVVLRNCGVINPEKISDYIAVGGYEALKKCLNEYTPQQVIDIVKESGLAGRGGAFFPTAVKWGLFAANPAPAGGHKYMVCNADEGDPGAFMDRATIEGDPHGLLEGMLIAAYATGADRGYIYCRAEYPLAIKRLKIAIDEAEKNGFLGDNILGKNFNFHLKIKEGAGAFVCGEETALMASVMGRRGMPTLKPPFPAVSGLFECPTNINNVETFENVAYIISKGAKEFNKYTSNGTIGTKVFALAGKVKRAGLVEIPVGMTIRELVERIGGGSSTGLPLKAVQMGGPSGGCIPARLFDTTIDVKSVTGTGAIMGSGGFIVMDEQTCMVDVAKYFLTFVQSESCGKCTFCRIGTKRMLEILNRITNGSGEEKDLERLQELAAAIKKSSLCALGQTAPNPVLTTMKYFPEEYEEHIKQKKCRAKVCKPLIKYGVLEDKCVGCGACLRGCPVKAISGEKKKPHSIDPSKCTRCGLCKDACKFAAIEVS
ncbi:MAG: 4Fe-4S binding protein [Spirochaetaceae bacterium]|jgi:NADH-quinone oxidoreductase subunit F|nr:4Fe-4S binding protein [Spirochaetaceae bacterium]